MGTERKKPFWWESRSPTRSFILGAVFLGVIVVAVLEPAMRAEPLRLAGLIAVAGIAVAAQCASAIATLVHRRRESERASEDATEPPNAKRPDSN
ncbi:MAG: hypothetical protein KF761_02120 [Salinibacterium sp.]|nr:hypothetical protein [Salinibacterium sp.]